MMNDKSLLEHGVSNSCPGGDAHACTCPAPRCGHCIRVSSSHRLFFRKRWLVFNREAVQGVCDTGRYRMAYYVWGEGPPILFVHGLGDSAPFLRAPLSRLSAHFRCIAYDLPSGHRDRARIVAIHTMTSSRMCGGDFDHLGLRQSYILGSSFGSSIALKAMHAHPERLPRGILQGGFAYRPLRRAEWLLAFLGSISAGPHGRHTKA